VHGELLVLGVQVAASTVWEILKDAGIDPSPERASITWADRFGKRSAAADTRGAVRDRHLTPRLIDLSPPRRPAQVGYRRRTACGWEPTTTTPQATPAPSSGSDAGRPAADRSLDHAHATADRRAALDDSLAELRQVLAGAPGRVDDRPKAAPIGDP
jgi:hypothetical protein